MRLLPLLVLIAKAIASINDADLLFSRGGIPDVAIPAEGSVVNPARKLQVSGCSTVGYDAEIFQDRTFDVSDYTTYDGLDPTALFASSIDMTDEYAVVGSDGYNIFQGIVHVYSPISETTWGLQALIRTPTHDNANFGVSVAVDGSRILVGANGYNVYDGAVFVYDWVLDTYWQNTARILSPLEGRNISQGFGYRVDLSGDFAIISTAINNAYIYEKQDKNWVPNTDLAPPADDVRFGRSVAIFGDYAIVGATGVGGSEGAAYIYRKFSSSGISTSSVYWDLYLELQSVEGYSSYFGYSVDINDRMAVVGAVGYRDRVWDSRGERRANDTGWVYIYPLNETTESSLTDKGPMTAIQSPVGDAGNFGAAVTLQDDSVLIGADGFPCGAEEGGAFLYTQDPADGTWALNRSYPSIDGPGSHFGWQVGLSPSYLAVGAFGYQDLQGAIHFAARKTPRFSASPTMLPSAAPTFEPTGVAAGLNIGGSNPDNNEELQIGLIVALFLAVLLAAIATGATIWCCCCFVVPVAGAKKKKKKKKEEENSPYTVHSYRGYSETDEYEYSEYEPSVISETYAPSYAPAPPMKKGGEKSVKFMDEEALRRAFPYKVYGPRGYQEGQNMDQEDLVRMKVEMNGDSKDLKFPVSQSAFPPPSAADMHDPRRQHQHGYPHHYSYTHHQKPQQQQYQPPSRPLSERSMYSAEGSYNTYGSIGAGSSYYSSSQTETEGGGEGDDDRSQYSSDSRSYTTQSQSIYSQRDRDGDGPSIAGDSYYSGRGSERESDREEPSVQLSAAQQAKVEEARAKYRAFKERSGSSGSRGGSSYEDSRFSGGASGGSLVESARARGRDYVRQGTEQSNHVVLSAEGGGGTESAEEDGQSVVSGSSGSQGSYVEQARERYARIVRRDGASAASATSGAGSEGEERSVSAGSDTSSLVHSAKARYATLREQQQPPQQQPPQQQPPQRSGYRSSSGDESQTHTYAGSSAGSSHASSLVEAAKARYAAMSRKMASTSGDSAEQSSGWDPQSLQTSNNRPFKQQSRGGDGSADESELNSQSASESHNVSLNVGYSRSVSSSRTQGLSVDVHSSSTAAQAPVQTQAPAAASGLPTISPATQARVNNARQAAMSKFALYKAKAEDEARRRAHDEARMQEQVLLERKQLEEVQRQREEEDDRVERAVEEARRRAERSEIEARAAARAHAEMEHSQHAEERQQQREQARLRAEQRARENFERAKAAEAAELLSRGSVSGSAAGSGSSVSVGSAPTAGAVMTASSPYSTEQQQRYDVIMAARAKMAETDANLTAARQRMASVSDDTANAVARSTLVSSSSSTTHTVTTTSSSKVVQNSTTTSSSIGGSSAVSSHTFSSATAGEDQSRDNGPQLAQLKDA